MVHRLSCLLSRYFAQKKEGKKLNKQEQCPCGSKKLFPECCMPIIQGNGMAETAEQLMRSRYTAFSKKENEYLLASWAKETRPKQLDTDEVPIKWIGLEVLDTEEGSSEDNSGTVSFIASFIVSGHLCHLQEKSRFTKKDEIGRASCRERVLRLG